MIAARAIRGQPWRQGDHGRAGHLSAGRVLPDSGAELATIVEKVAHLKERRQVRMFVRRDPYGRYLSCLIYLPRDRYTTAVRRRMEEILIRALGGASVDYTARVTESVLARLTWSSGCRSVRPWVSVDVRSLERELTLATRTWDDEFADLIAGMDDLTGWHPGGRTARGIQGGLRPAAGDPGPHRADRT